ncbi:MAG: hypothetical protein UD936_05445, partial [Acutalibacteraceae bacterium]|nr:hypothetical protein [Acutalibacteraceae bacterium]
EKPEVKGRCPLKSHKGFHPLTPPPFKKGGPKLYAFLYHSLFLTLQTTIYHTNKKLYTPPKKSGIKLFLFFLF